MRRDLSRHGGHGAGLVIHPVGVSVSAAAEGYHADAVQRVKGVTEVGRHDMLPLHIGRIVCAAPIVHGALLDAPIHRAIFVGIGLSLVLQQPTRFFAGGGVLMLYVKAVEHRVRTRLLDLMVKIRYHLRMEQRSLAGAVYHVPVGVVLCRHPAVQQQCGACAHLYEQVAHSLTVAGLPQCQLLIQTGSVGVLLAVNKNLPCGRTCFCRYAAGCQPQQRRQQQRRDPLFHRQLSFIAAKNALMPLLTSGRTKF